MLQEAISSILLFVVIIKTIILYSLHTFSGKMHPQEILFFSSYVSKININDDNNRFLMIVVVKMNFKFSYLTVKLKTLGF